MNEQGPALPWTDSFSVGVEMLDADHRALVQLINEVCDHWCSVRKIEALERLEALTTLAGEHFQREEGVLRGLAGYGEHAAHAGEHRNRMHQLIALRQRFDAAPAPGSQGLCLELVDWFVRQSIGHDAAIKAYFDSGGARYAARPHPRKAS